VLLARRFLFQSHQRRPRIDCEQRVDGSIWEEMHFIAANSLRARRWRGVETYSCGRNGAGCPSIGIVVLRQSGLPWAQLLT
jgi:hypothetical protein